MLSPAAEHRNRMANQPNKAAAAAVVLLPHESILLKQFAVDRNRLATIRSRTSRTTAKRGILENYSEWIGGFNPEAGYTREQESMFTWLLLWNVDVGNWEQAIKMAAFALASGLNAPVEFTRTLAETVTEQLADGINRAGEHERYKSLLDSLHELVRDQDMTDQITAKLYKACGLACIETDKERAKAMFIRAIELNPNAGVKRLLKQLSNGKKPVKTKNYSLSARNAAAELGVSLPTVIRHAKKHPDRLHHTCIQMGIRTVYRFNLADVKQYKINYLGKKL